MKNDSLLFYRIVRDFLTIYLPKQRGASQNTAKSYRDTLNLFIDYISASQGTPLADISFKCISREPVESFLMWLETDRGYSVNSRNQRMCAVKSFLRYAAEKDKILMPLFLDVKVIPKKKDTRVREIEFFSESALKAILEQPDRNKKNGQRDLFFMILMYDTGARVQELVDLTLGDIRLTHPAMVILTGKGQKSRQIPLMKETCRLMDRYISRFHPPKAPKETPLFYNRDKKPLTRYGVTYILKKYAKKADAALNSKIISPHVLRHTKAMHLLRAGVNMIYIRDFLGHVEITTTEVYARIDAEMKRKVFEETVPNYIPETVMPWEEDEDLLEWLTHFGKKAF